MGRPGNPVLSKRSAPLHRGGASGPQDGLSQPSTCLQRSAVWHLISHPQSKPVPLPPECQ